MSDSQYMIFQLQHSEANISSLKKYKQSGKGKIYANNTKKINRSTASKIVLTTGFVIDLFKKMIKIIKCITILTTVTPKIITKRSEASPITITAIAHCGSKTLSSAYPTVG